MFKFERDQITCRIGSVELGGQPGERPTVLIGSIFFAHHKIVQDSQRGLFDRSKALALLHSEEEASSFSGNPRFIDPVADTSEALIRYIEFLAAQTTAPILVDSPLSAVRMETLRHFAGTEVMPRLIYNSLSEDCTAEELVAIRESGLKNAIVLAFSTRAMRPGQRVKLLEERLLPAARSAGIENVLVDVGVLDIASASWSALAIREVKTALGLPTGCAPANALCTWHKMASRGDPPYTAAMASTLAMLVSQGADLLLYGPMRFAPWVYPAVGAANALQAYSGRLTGVRPASAEHPLFRLLQ
ncbi:MAG TPA: tetrahydromethanopterin S-methyltransferase subunit H [Anaerolineae bacterium]|nr:tetrahydromethanopterin S-methyltransferase subunit H [Anaerolineae bacterium]HQJ52401.1 tetrahydromethanopterin S-methyltransferase subunit H [Anaerolineae bacterium]